LRFLPWWVRQGRGWARTWPEVLRPLIGWHMIPVLVWLLWPQRLWHFLFFLSPANAGERPAQSMTEGWTSYWQFLVEDYHLALGSVIVATTLVCVAIAKVRRLRPGASVLIVFLAVSVLATVHHPNRKSRFTHSWVGVAWVLAGAGLAELAFTRRRRLLTPLRPWLAAGAACALLAAHAPMLLQAGAAPEAGVRLDRPSSRSLQERILSHVDGARRVAILSNQPIKFFVQWPILERFGDRVKVETDLRGLNVANLDAAALEHWLAAHQFDRILVLDVAHQSPFHEIPPPPGFERLPDLLNQHTALELVQRSTNVADGCTLWIWRRK